MVGKTNKNASKQSRITRTPTIRLGQINTRNCRIVMDQLREAATRNKIDILMIQEPFTHPKGNNGMGMTTRILTDKKQFSNLSGPGRLKAAIAILNPEFSVVKLEQFCNTHCICAEITASGYQFYVISAYFQYSDNIEPYLSHLDGIIRNLRGKSIIISADANAKSHFWFSGETNDRGLLLEDFIATNNLYVANGPSNAHTFDNIHGRSNIDVTLATNACFNRIQKWEVHPDWTTSDHNAITFVLNPPVDNVPRQNMNRYNIARADWDKFEDTLRNIVSHNPHTVSNNTTQLNVNALADEIEETLKSACDTAIPKKTRFPKSAPWWNEQITILKREANYARREFQRARNPSIREHLKTQYRAFRNHYNAAIRKSKIHGWRKFVTSKGNEDPWSLPYKIITKKIKPIEVSETIKVNNVQALSWNQANLALLNSLIPDDNTINETAWHINIRETTQTPPNTEDTPPFGPLEIRDAIASLKNRKAPGLDLIEAEVIKYSWPTLCTKISELLNNCLQYGIFPRKWKQGNIRVLLKSDDKDKTDPKSFRPICLLPILGKALEKLISGRLETIFHHHPKSSDRQFGFKKKRTTEEAIVLMRTLTKESAGKYTIALLFDISGAFDNVWWPSILYNLKTRDCPRNLYKLIQSYLSERSVCISDNNLAVRKIATKGCPQGSVLGPNFWNLVFDEVIVLIQSLGFEPIAYADDLAVLISGNTRRELEISANNVTKAISSWCSKHKLQISETKSVMLLVKGFLDITRPPTVKVGNKSLKMPQSARYLGIQFGTRYNITPHINYITTKSRNIFNSLSHIAKSQWGLNHNSMKTLYKGIFIPIITYAAAGWCDKINVHHTRKIRQAQRHALLRVIKAYRTIANDALRVLAAEIPIELLLIERKALYHAKRGEAYQNQDLNIVPPGNAEEYNETEIKGKIRNHILDRWQLEWDQSSTGRITYEFFSDIRRRLSSPWINLTFHTTQFLSGHGKIRDYLKKRCILPSETCTCGEADSINHILFDCGNYLEERGNLIRCLRNNDLQWPCNLGALTRKETFDDFATFATHVMRSREEEIGHHH